METDPNATVRITPEREQNTENPSVFIFRRPRLGTWTRLGKEVGKLTNFDASSNLADMSAVFESIADTIRHLLVGWENVTDEAGEVMTFDPSRLEDAVHPSDIGDLAAQVYASGMLDADEKKG